MDLHANAVSAFEQDVRGNESTLQSLMGSDDWHWFRYPYLREGDTAEKHRAVLAFLGERHYKVAQVTLSFDDYAYNEPYARCLAKNDTQSIDWLKQSFLSRAADQSRARTRGGAPAVWTRHQTCDAAAHRRLSDGDAVAPARSARVARLHAHHARRRTGGRRLREPPDLTANWNGTLLHQLMTARHLPLPPGDGVFEKLAALCQ